jgi:uncharacterized protein YegL
MTPPARPDPTPRRKPLHVFFLIDCSAEMLGAKIATLNATMSEAVADLQKLDSDPRMDASILVHAIGYSTGAWWHIGPKGTDIQHTVWLDMPANGASDLGAALRLLNGGLTRDVLGPRPLRPVIMVISSSRPTDNWKEALQELDTNPYWRHTVRRAMAIGADADHTSLEEIIGSKEIPVDSASNGIAGLLLAVSTWDQITWTADDPRWNQTPVSSDLDVRLPQRPVIQPDPKFFHQSQRRNTMTTPARPIGVPQAKKPLNIIFLLDCSSSMAGQKIGTLNAAMREAVADLQKIDSAPDTYGKIQFRAIAFAQGAWWHVQDATDMQKTTWTDLPANGNTDLGAALALLNTALVPDSLGIYLLPPVLVLVSDGQPNDNWTARLAELKKNRYWKHCVRIAIAIGDDAERKPLEAFIDWDPKDERTAPLLEAHNASQLAAYIKWATTVVTGSIMSAESAGTGGGAGAGAGTRTTGPGNSIWDAPNAPAAALPPLPSVPAAQVVWGTTP